MLFGFFLALITLVDEPIGNWLNTNLEFSSYLPIETYLVLATIIEFVRVELPLRKYKIDAPLILTGSFLFLIVVGVILLSLPQATRSSFSMTDRIFMSVSAVCVTGLSVKDLSSDFTGFGQGVLLLLIQLGGLGIMTFTSFFGFLFRGSTSFEEQILLKNLNQTDNISNVLQLVSRIVVITLFFECIGGVLIYASLPDLPGGERLFFSIFHTISAFCNAGFSTYSDGLADPIFQYNGSLQLTIAGLFILGGIGFPILLNGLRYIGYWGIYLYKRVVLSIKHPRKKIVISLNTRIVLVTTILLLIAGPLAYFSLEYTNTLHGLPLSQQLITSFFQASTPRTAGFSTLDLNTVSTPTFILIGILMWIGASPGSTGGGVKTSSVAIAVLEVLSTARRRKRIELRYRWIEETSVKRAFTIIFLSLVAISIGALAIAILEPGLGLKTIAFECVSAYSTVGLSMGITTQLSDPSKWVIIGLMFIGRVGTITLLWSLFRAASIQAYQYPEEGVLIN